MLRTMRKINKQLDKSKASEAGDVLMAVAKALGLTWYATPVGPERGTMYSDCEWRFGDVIEARDAFRAGVEKLKAKLVQAA
jgi:hypothetical protein